MSTTRGHGKALPLKELKNGVTLRQINPHPLLLFLPVELLLIARIPSDQILIDPDRIDEAPWSPKVIAPARLLTQSRATLEQLDRQISLQHPHEL